MLQGCRNGLFRALVSLLKLRHLMPAIDVSLANPRLPGNIDQHAVDLEFLDFFNVQEEEKSRQRSTHLFKQSPFYQAGIGLL